jgi:KUP system potassium uptake protein
VVAGWLWGWGRVPSLLTAGAFLAVDLLFFAANSHKIPSGGWVPLAIGGLLFILFTTWKRGREILFERLDVGMAIQELVANLGAFPPTRVAGTAVFLSARRDRVPHALLHNLVHNKVLHERVIFLTLMTQEIPHVAPKDRLDLESLGNGFYRLMVRYGFKDPTDIPAALAQAAAAGLVVDLMTTSFFFSRETLIPRFGSGMALWRERLFSHMARSAGSPMEYFRIPSNRVIEVGTQIEL